MKKSNIYTRRGDSGQTSLVGGQRVEKTCARLESYGTVDELNSHIGVLMAEIEQDSDTYTTLLDIQRILFVVGSYLATDTTTTELRSTSIVTDEMLAQLESTIDVIDASLPPLRLFVLPSGTRAASLAHVCRTVCRRAERRILALNAETPLMLSVLAYVNRLSDYFFLLARQLNCNAGHEEVVWRPKKSEE